jgi:APA family basic amino acid/polyamine antiporter
MVLIKIAVLLMFVGIAVTAFNSEHLHPFMPMGMKGVGAAASTIFFSYIGIDAISTASEEVANPRRNLPRAIIFSLVIVTSLYIVVALASVSAQPYTEFNDSEASMAAILRQITGARWPSLILSLGAIVSIFSVLLVNLYGQTRILFVMARDGLMPSFFARINRRTKTPVQNTIIVCLVVAIAAAFFPLDVLADMTSMGTLVAFSVVSLGVLILRKRRPELSRNGFRVPFFPITPVVSAMFCFYLILGLSRNTFILFGVWITLAILLYFSFGHRHSALAENRG